MTRAGGLLLLLGVAAMTAAANDVPVSPRINMRVDAVAARRDGPAYTCGAARTQSPDVPVSFAFWGTLADAGEHGQCAAGSFSGGTGTPFLVYELSADVGWDAGTMDPGPLGAFQLLLSLRTRQRVGVTKDGQAQYGAPVVDHRLVRLEPGEEFVVPLQVDAQGRETLGVHDVLLRVRAVWAGREGAVSYGAVAVSGVAPGSDIMLDGGVAGHAGTDGNLLLRTVTAGRREVRLRGASGTTVSRTVQVMPGRISPLAPEVADGGSAPQPALQATGKNAEGFEEYRRERDGATMVLIPQGEFQMGNLETEGKPEPHTVYVSTFLMDKLPLTVGRYKRFAMATGWPLPPDPYWGVHDEDPVSFVRWDEGKAYCEWAGGRLPTEAEREKATRGTDGRLFPWGSEPPTPERAVFRRNWGQQGNDTAGIRPTGAGPYGLLDTGGNMWEFCEDWYSPDYFKSSPPKDPPGPKTGRARIVKGGSWDSRPTVLSASSRNFAYTGYREGDFGFRCAANVPR